MAAALSGDFLPQCDDLLRCGHTAGSRSAAVRMARAGRISVRGTRGKPHAHPALARVRAAGHLSKTRGTENPMDQIVVGVGEFRLGDTAGHVLTAYGLGPCIALTAYD